MTIRVGINGFGRIGRLVARALLTSGKDIQLVAINDPMMNLEQIKHIFNYDSVHGKWNSKENNIYVSDNELIINNKVVKVFHEREPEKIKWDDYDVDYLVESTGIFTKHDGASRHLVNNKKIKCVVVSAPSPDIPMFVMGVNHKKYNNEKIISNASCTTNCLAPLVKILNDNFGVKEGLMSTIHAATSTQNTVDGISRKNLRLGRSLLNNIIPSSTGAAKAVGKILPEVDGKLTGMAFRVPVPDCSVVDLTVKLEKKTNLDEIEECIRHNLIELTGIIDITNDEVVSSDIIGNKCSLVFDKKASVMLNDTFFKLIAWYDNEWGYSNRIVDLICHIAN